MGKSRLIPILLCGGEGMRLWPLSQGSRPKPLLKLSDGRSLLDHTLARVSDRARYEVPVIICQQKQYDAMSAEAREAGYTDIRFILEPGGRNTAPALTAAALHLRGTEPDAQMLVLPADHWIEDSNAFAAAVNSASQTADKDFLVTFGIRPSRAETGYGYIRHGQGIDGTNANAIAAFVEKPDLETAVRYVQDGDYDWNSGMFLFPLSLWLDEIAHHEPEMVASCADALDGARQEKDTVNLSDAFLNSVATSIDYAVMEHTKRAAVVRVDFGWSDLGSYTDLWGHATKDGEGNAWLGAGHAYCSANNYIHTPDLNTLLVGVEDLIVVQQGGQLLIARRDAAQDIKQAVEAMKKER